jgi:hypothetical protein
VDCCKKKKANRAKKLKHRYGISIEQYEQMLIDQNYRCKICGSTDMLIDQNYRCKICGSTDPGHKKKHFSVDHCHETGRVRGLLCANCNLTLGYVKDDVALLKSCIVYLQAA